MKIGIVTFHRVPNYGALLQTYALSSYLECRGHEVYIITDGFGGATRYSLQSILLSRNVTSVRNKLQHNSSMSIVDEFDCHFRTISSKALRGELAEFLNVLVVGSDQVWNPDWCLPYLRDVFLDFPNRQAKRLSYAASFGQRAWAGCEAETAGTLLAQFNAISVREESGIGIVAALAKREAQWLPDPTLLFDADFYFSLPPVPQTPNDEPYLFSFIRNGKDGQTRALEERIMAEQDISRRLSDVVSAPCTPVERLLKVERKCTVGGWVERIRNSHYVVTNSFHAVVFSILHRRPFVAVPLNGAAEGMNVRIESLMNRLGLKGRFYKTADAAVLRAILETKIDWDDVHERIRSWRQETDQFFRAQGL